VQTHAAAAIGRLVDRGSLKRRISQLSGMDD
jgi:hypothetical protein